METREIRARGCREGESRGKSDEEKVGVGGGGMGVREGVFKAEDRKSRRRG